MNRRAVAGIAIAVALILIIVFSIRGNAPKGVDVYAEPAKVQQIEAVVTAPGEIDPRFKVNISAHVIGKIDHLYFNEGDLVKKGQKLVELEKPAYLAQRDARRADVANRRIEVIRARAAMANAEASYGRAMNMRRQGIQAQEIFDRARLDLDNARAAYGSAEEGVRQAQAGLLQAETDLSHTTLLSPIDGKVVELNAREGEVVITGTMNNPGSVIAVIADLSEILVVAEVNETEVVGIRGGQAAKVHVDAVSDHDYRGHVSEIGSSAAVRQNGGTGIRYFRVKVQIDDPDERLRPGMTSQVSIVTSSVANSIAVPIQSVVERVPGAKPDDLDSENLPKKKYVFVVANDKVKQTEVTTGISDATRVVIATGIKAGEQIVTGPFRILKKLRDGDAVKIVKETKSSDKDEKEKDK
ncbi:MAG: efflux transporter, family, subunit [Acidobacteria bacterium]|nr:efflux transporter, family, subunit [Acidobacteriota bacterium]